MGLFTQTQNQFGPSQSKAMLGAMLRKPEDFWFRARNAHSVSLFKAMAERVPAYKSFLKQNKINPAKIKSYGDLQSVPPVSKDNYLRRHALTDLVWDGKLDKPHIFSATSGSTGHPFYFPRNEELEWQSSLLHEFFLSQGEKNPKNSSLVIVGFGMGAWIGGLITTSAFRQIAERGTHSIALLTPGSNKKEIFDGIKNLGKNYGQIILCGYPPFLKDVIDEAPSHGIRLKDYNFKFVFAAEAFSEGFRDYIAEKTGIKNVYQNITNIYGTADLGTMAMETPLSILVRRFALKNEKMFENLFPGVKRLPTLAQFNPLFVNFDEFEGQLLCTGNNTLPLFRYAVGDHGGVRQYGQVDELLKPYGTSLKKEMVQAGLTNSLPQMPFVYVYERSDLSTKWYGAIIYPEHVREALEHPSVRKVATGRFTLVTKTDKKHNQSLEVNLEMHKGQKAKASLKNQLMELVQKKLFEKNAEYSYLLGLMPQRMKPQIVLLPHEDPRYFTRAGKQKWIKK